MRRESISELVDELQNEIVAKLEYRFTHEEISDEDVEQIANRVACEFWDSLHDHFIVNKETDESIS